MLDNTSDFKSLICYLILLLVFYSIYKKNYIILTYSWSFTSYSLGGGDVFGLPFVRYYLPLLYIITFYFLILPNKPQSENKKFDFFNILLFIILLKIVLDSLVFGIDEFRAESLIIAFHVIILSFYIFHKSFDVNGYRKTVNDFVVSGLLVHGIISVVLFYPISQTQLLPALGFGHRITIFNQDTINSAKPFFFYIVFLLAGMHLKLISAKYLKYFTIVIAIFCLIIVLLNGSRQYSIALLFVVIIPFLKFNIRTILLTVFFIVFLPLFLNFIIRSYSETAIVERFSRDELYRENEEGRSAIWEKGFNQMFSENPILGLGFRNFGEVGDVSDPNSSTVVIRKDNAHGFFQEVFIEHGVVLGILLLVSVFYTIFKFRVYSQNDLSEFNAIFLVLIAFFVTSFFSGSFLNGVGYFYLGVFIYHIPKLNITK